MMCSLNSLVRGLAEYCKKELLCKYPPESLMRFGIGVYIDSILCNPEPIIEKIKGSPFFYTFIQNDTVDLENLCKIVKDNMGESGVAFELPIFGKIKLNKSDVDLIHDCII